MEMETRQKQTESNAHEIDLNQDKKQLEGMHNEIQESKEIPNDDGSSHKPYSNNTARALDILRNQIKHIPVSGDEFNQSTRIENKFQQLKTSKEEYKNNGANIMSHLEAIKSFEVFDNRGVQNEDSKNKLFNESINYLKIVVPNDYNGIFSEFFRIKCTNFVFVLITLLARQ